ncbi:MAG: TonB-dependent receptor plug domain-containing protein [Butyricimonas paravirosa]
MSLGTATNARGYFSIELPIQQGTLEFTFVGFKNKRVAFSEKTDTLRVVLEEDVKAIEEVVVTGYQAIKEKAMAGSYSKVKAEELVMTGNETIESMLQGKVPGMVVINQSGLTGTRQKVRVRGTSTLVGNAEPVWVVDGIIQEDNLPFETSELGAIGDSNLDMMKDFIGGAISWLNPNDIEDITVLKDASASDLWGEGS